VPYVTACLCVAIPVNGSTLRARACVACACARVCVIYVFFCRHMQKNGIGFERGKSYDRHVAGFVKGSTVDNFAITTEYMCMNVVHAQVWIQFVSCLRTCKQVT
jgi:hypothetical protein